MDIQRWYERGQYLYAQGHKLFYVDSMQDKPADAVKPVILLIHGFPTASWDWAKLWPALNDKYRLIAMDMLGFGYSDKPARHTYSIMEQADLIETLIETLQLQHFFVLAHDYGDTVAQELLARQNNGGGAGKWLSVCFLNGGLFPETHHALFIQKLLLSPIGPLVNSLSSKSRFARSFTAVFGKDSPPSEVDIDSFWALITFNNGKLVFHKLITYMKDRRRHRERWVQALINSSVPIGLINGSSDPVSGAHMIARYKEVVGEPDFLVELTAIGHYPQVEAPAQVAQHYLHFISDHEFA